jgi:CHAT domain-containing protein/tetratricopeptide (TPR) repeat protein
MLRAVVLLLAVVALRADAEDAPDLRALLSKTKHRIFTARMVGVSVPPEPVTPLGTSGDAELLEAVTYWLRVGKEYQTGVSYAGSADAYGEIRFRAESLADVLILRFENRHQLVATDGVKRRFNDTDLQAWTNMALATAASGDYKGGAELLEGIAETIDDGESLVSDDTASTTLRGDAIALWFEHSVAQNDIDTLLDTLQKTMGTVIPLELQPLLRDRILSLRDYYAAAHFNRGLVLEKFGLYRQAIESYHRSLELSDDERWNEETARRINRIGQPSPRERWLDARARMEAASREGDVRTVRDIVRLSPEHARIAGEKKLLAAWARGALVGSTVENPDLEVARSIGAARRDLFADSLLADTVQVIDQSIRENDAHRIESLARGFLLCEQGGDAATFEEAAAAFDVAGCPMANAARFLAIRTRFDAIPIDQSLQQLRQLDRGVPARHRVLGTMIEGATGNCLAERGELEAALDIYTRAQHVFEVLGETDSVASMRTSAAHMLTLLGDPVEAWRIRLPALRAADASGDPALVEFVFRYAASDELFDRKEWRGLALYGSVLPVPPLYARPGDEGRGSRWRNPVPLRSRQDMLDALSDRPLPADVRNDLRVAQAISLYQRMPRQAEALLSESIAFAEATGRVAMLPYVYFYRAMTRCETKRGDDTVRDMKAYYDAMAPCDAKREEDAIRDLTYAISLLEVRRRNTARQELRDISYRVADDMFSELTNLYWTRGDDNALFALGERRRGLAFLDGVTAASGAVEALTAEGIAARLEPGTAVIVFTFQYRRSLATIIEKDRVEMHRFPRPPGNYYFRALELRMAVKEESLSEIQSVAEALYELLIRPVRISSGIRRLVIVADHPLEDVPFAILRDRQSGQYLIQQFELVRAASASVFAQTKGAALTPLRRAVAVGDPAFDRNAYPTFSSLPAARAEAVAIGRQYPQSRTLTGRTATFPNLAASVQTADVVHIAAHTAPSVEEHEVRELLLAPSRQHAGTCSVGDAAHLPLKKGSIVLVPGCRTGASGEPGTLRDFAGSFLAAGARNVVATLWDIEDDPSRAFALLFHRSLRRCGSAITATREAQLAMLRSSNDRVRHPRAWSGFQVYGVGQ